MTRRKRHLLLVLILIILLGALGVLLLIRRRMNLPPVPLPAPTVQSSPSPAPVLPSEKALPGQTAESGPASPTAIPTEAPAETPEPEQTGSPSPEAERNAAVRALFERFAGEHTGRWNLCFVALPGGEPVLWGEEGGPMVSASLIKLPILGAVYERLEQGGLDREACEAWLGPMITVSDNGSANALVRLLGDGDAAAGMAAVNDWCLRQGLTNTRQNRLMLEDNGLQNYTSAGDCAIFLEALYRGDCVSAEADREMLSLLLRQQVKDRLPLGLPEGTPIAHKTGDLIGLCWADVGIVYSPGGDYILCAISDGQASEREAKSATAELSRQIYEIMNP